MAILTQKQIMGGTQPRTIAFRSAKPSQARHVPKALFGWGSKKERDEEKEEQYRLQQEVLARRKNNSWQKEVKERRAITSRYLRDPEFKKQVDAEKRKRFQEKMAAEPPIPKFGIIIPLSPIGIPEYEEERFDLRLPYVDNGWVDEEGNTLSDFGRSIGGLFGLGKKKKDEGKKDDGKRGKKK